MKKDVRELDIEQWILDYLNSDHESKVKNIIKDKDLVEKWFLGKEIPTKRQQ